MKLMTWIGLALVALGIVGVLMGTIPIVTGETIFEAGPVRIESESSERVPLPLYGGIAAIIIGAGLLLFARRSR